ncbi:MAG: sulfurtransferase [Candidatus Acidiferrales bacterium]
MENDLIYTTLISAADLKEHIGRRGWRIFDCRCSANDPSVGKKLYQEGHIPGARHADLDHVLAAPRGPYTGRHPLPRPEMLAAWLGAEGVSEQTQMVAYDDTGGAFAARLWWLARWLGHDAVAVLDGGIQAWRAAGGKRKRGNAAAPEAALFNPREPLVKMVDVREVARIVALRHSRRLVDARTRVRYLGEHEPIDPVAGHIPGARNRPFGDNLDAKGKFLLPGQLRTRFSTLARDPHDVIHYCGSGVTACHNVLAMEHAGFGGSRLYPGSWSEWILDPQRPVERGAPET